MNKLEFIQITRKETGSIARVCNKHYDAIFRAITKAVIRDGSFSILGFGTFKIVSRKARKGAHPQTRERIMIPANKTIAFRPCREFRWAVNEVDTNRNTVR